MDKVISFGKGIRRQPSIGDAGELSELVNLIPKNGELVNVSELAPLGKTLEGDDVLTHVHHTKGGDNYIAIGSTNGSLSLVYYNEEWTRKVIDDSLPIDEGDNLPNIESIGNTIVLLLKGGVRYYLWKDGKYMNLGNKPPQIDISFGLQGECVRTEDIIELSPPKGFSASKDANGNLTGVAYFEEDKDFINDKVLGEVNKFINSESVEKGRFIYPFLVRYAYRMYDGSLIMHSSPVLMVCSTACAPSFVVEEARNVSNGESPTLECRVMGVTHKLDYSIDTEGIAEKLEGWSDIIKSVDVFVSPQIYTYDPNGEVGRIRTSDTLESNGYAICKHINQRDTYTENGYLKQYQKKYISGMYATTFSNDWSFVASHFELPSKTEEEVLGALKNESRFYLLDTITIDKFPEKGKRTIIEVKDDILQTLTTREVMSDDYYSNDGLSAEYAKSYNSRLSLSGVERVLYDGKLVSSVFPYTDGFVIKDATTQWMNGTQDVRYAVYIKEDGKDIVVGGDLTLSKYGVIEKRLNRLLYFFYPNPNAYKLVVEAKLYVDEGGSFVPSPNFYKYTVALERHNLLNGAFFFNGWENGILETSNIKGLTVESGYSSTINNLVSSDKSVRQRGQVYTSDTSNPFFFFPSGISQIGYGDVIRIETSAKALSPSQFGQFPLYAFCTDGIWALEVTKDGTYLPPKIVSNDVCNNPNSITQIESSIVFTTDQGLKLIQGSEVVLLSGQMDGHNVDESIYFKPKPNGPEFFAGYGLSEYDKLVTPSVTDDFRTILATSKIAYDYPNRLLRIYPNSGDKWYVYSLESQEFSSEEPLDGGVKAVVAGYPTSLIQVGGGLYTFRNEASDDMRDGLLLTRPIDMGEPFAMKKLHDMRTLYTKYSDSTFVKVVIYVSNDGVSWAVLPSLRRGSFKYYRLAMITRMTDADRLSGTVMRYTVERSNKLR